MGRVRNIPKRFPIDALFIGENIGEYARIKVGFFRAYAAGKPTGFVEVGRWTADGRADFYTRQYTGRNLADYDWFLQDLRSGQDADGDCWREVPVPAGTTKETWLRVGEPS